MMCVSTKKEEFDGNILGCKTLAIQGRLDHMFLYRPVTQKLTPNTSTTPEIHAVSVSMPSYYGSPFVSAVALMVIGFHTGFKLLSITSVCRQVLTEASSAEEMAVCR